MADFVGLALGEPDGVGDVDSSGATDGLAVWVGFGSGTTGVSSSGTTTSGFLSPSGLFCVCSFGALSASTVNRVESIKASGWPEFDGKYRRGSFHRPSTSTSK